MFLRTMVFGKSNLCAKFQLFIQMYYCELLDIDWLFEKVYIKLYNIMDFWTIKQNLVYNLMDFLILYKII